MKADKAVRIDRRKSLAEEQVSGHNRWHPDIIPVLVVEPGEIVCLETRDALDCQIGPTSTAEDLATIDPYRTHPLTGPVYVDGAEPGDLLEVEVLEVVPEPYGFGVETSGYGLLRDEFPQPYLMHFALQDGIATSAQLPGVALTGAPFMGVMGVAPSHEFLQTALSYERALGIPGYSPSQPLSSIPPHEPIASSGLITVPPRSNGGNIDVKQLTKGAILQLPVSVPGALFSTGDAHFIQGESECVTGLEMGATLYCRFGLRKGVAHERGIREPRFRRDDYFCAPELAVPKRFFATIGQSFRYDGEASHDSITSAARSALRQMIEYLQSEYGFDAQQSYMICSLAVDVRISQAVNRPNYTVSAILPLDIFID